MTRAFKYPLRPTHAQGLLCSLDGSASCCDLYNSGLHERREAWRVQEKADQLYRSDAPADRNQGSRRERPRSSDADCEVRPPEAGPGVRGFLSALQGAVALLRSLRFPGSRRRYGGALSFEIERPRCSLQGNRIRVPKLGLVRFHRYRPIEGAPKQATVTRDAAGSRWWVLDLLRARRSSRQRLPSDPRSGSTFGLASFGDVVPMAPRSQTLAGSEPVLLPACDETSGRRYAAGNAARPPAKRARVHVARAMAHVANQRSDFARKLACDLFRRYDLVAHEDLGRTGWRAATLGSRSTTQVGASFCKRYTTRLKAPVVTRFCG